MQFIGQHITDTSGIFLESLGDFWRKPAAQAHELTNDDIRVLVETYIEDRRVEQYIKDRRMGNDLEIEPSSAEKRKCTARAKLDSDKLHDEETHAVVILAN